jgi:hypothetical protein
MGPPPPAWLFIDDTVDGLFYHFKVTHGALSITLPPHHSLNLFVGRINRGLWAVHTGSCEPLTETTAVSPSTQMYYRRMHEVLLLPPAWQSLNNERPFVLSGTQNPLELHIPRISIIPVR